ncbi:MAG: hypothetical protein ACOCPO_03265, partial [Desulfohalobiaceae bacterium]
MDFKTFSGFRTEETTLEEVVQAPNAAKLKLWSPEEDTSEWLNFWEEKDKTLSELGYDQDRIAARMVADGEDSGWKTVQAEEGQEYSGVFVNQADEVDGDSLSNLLTAAEGSHDRLHVKVYNVDDDSYVSGDWIAASDIGNYTFDSEANYGIKLWDPDSGSSNWTTFEAPQLGEAYTLNVDEPADIDEGTDLTLTGDIENTSDEDVEHDLVIEAEGAEGAVDEWDETVAVDAGETYDFEQELETDDFAVGEATVTVTYGDEEVDYTFDVQDVTGETFTLTEGRDYVEGTDG